LSQEVALILLGSFGCLWAGNRALNQAGKPSAIETAQLMATGYLGYLIGAIGIIVALAL